MAAAFVAGAGVEEEGDGAAAGAVLESEVAARVTSRGTGDGEAHAEAGGVLGAEEGFEHRAAHLGGDAATGVRDAELDSGHVFGARSAKS